MNRGLRVVAGPVRSGKTERLVERYRRHLAAGPPGGALWLAPNHRTATAVRHALVGRSFPGALNPHCLSFEQFARRVLDASPLVVRPLGALGRRHLLGRLIDEALDAGRLDYFGPIARTAGFLDLVVGFVEELKRLEIWPQELRAARGLRAAPKDRELWQIYDAYQRTLNEHDLYDPQGCSWSARGQLREGRAGPYAAVRHVVVDGFVDFTRTEHEMLQILAGRVESMTISLPLARDSCRSELFAKSAATLAELERRHPGLTVERVERSASGWPVLDHLERTLFSAPGQIASSPEPVGIEIVPAAGVTSEVEQLARRIKALLVDGDEAAGGVPVRPSEVLVVFRSLDDATAELVGDTFAQYGIPAAIAGAPRLARSPVVRALTDWLELDLEDWPYRRLLAALVHNRFRPAWPEWLAGRAATAAEHVVRRLAIPSGRAALGAQLERLAASVQQSESCAEARIPSTLAQEALLALPLVRRIGEMLDALPQRATLSDWVQATGALADAAGLLHAPADDRSDGAATDTDRLEWEQFTGALSQLARLSAWLGRGEVELSRREFFQHVQEALRTVPLPRSGDEAGRVLVLPAESARQASAPYVFVAGLSERAFPLADREDCLYGEAEMRELVAAGLPLVPRAQRRSHEMLLFYQVVTRATRRLVLSYAALDDAAQPLSPSPYLSEVEQAFAPHSLRPSEPPGLSTVPTSDAVFSPRDFRVRAVARALDGDAALVTRLAAHRSTGETARNLFGGLRAASLRERGETFGPFEGMLASEAAQAVLAERFGPQRVWSPSQLEQYALCPFQFFMERVLNLEAIDDPGLSVDYANRGRMLHSVLAALHQRINEQAGGHTSPGAISESGLAEAIDELVAELLESRQTGRPLPDGLLEIDVRRLTAALADYYRQHERYDALSASFEQPLRPAHFEVSFGPLREHDEAAALGEIAGPLASREPFELLCGGQTVRFAGRIDRIDLGTLAGQTVFGIIDYKSGRSESAKVKAIVEGFALQLPLYALAAQQLLAPQRALPVRVGYWHVATKGCKESLALHEEAGGALIANEAWQNLLDELPRRVLALVRGIREGQFPMASADPHCTGHCPFNTGCRVNQVRSLGKAWSPPEEDAP